jgi:glycine betaine/choline ABC-type transport system substrate-binding protein
MFPAYVGSFDATVANDHETFATANAAYLAGRTYAEKHGVALLPPTPFANNDAVALKSVKAEHEHVASIGDLNKLGSVRLAVPPTFRAGQPGLVGLKRAYGLERAKVVPVPTGGQYPATEVERADVAVVRTTDAQLALVRWTVLRDPKHVFGFGNLAPAVSSHVVTAEGPAFAQTITAVSRTLTTPAMQRLSLAVLAERRPPAMVARQFLQANGLL